MQNGSGGMMETADISPSVNSATLKAIRAMVRPLLQDDRSKGELTRRLDRRGFMLRRHDETTYLATAPHGKLICKLSEL